MYGPDGKPIEKTGPEDPTPKSPKAEEKPKKNIPDDPTPKDPTPSEPKKKEIPPWKKWYPNKDWWEWRKKQHRDFMKKSPREKLDHILDEYVKWGIFR